ncbi:MAG: AAA family ATPase, partial [Candidatus Heimdallarchaeaceae archaeon]
DKYRIVIRAEENFFKCSACEIELGIKYDANKRMYRDVIKSDVISWVELSNDGAGYSNIHILQEEAERRKNFPRIKMYKKIKLDKFTSKDFSFLNPPSGDNLLTILQTHEDLFRLFNDILYSFNLRLMLREIDETIEFLRDVNGKLTSIPFNLIAETFQQLFLVLGAIETNKNSIIIFEEPETHLFPKYSKKIAEMIAKDKKANQFFISTHNPYFLISLIEKAKDEDINIFAVEFIDNKTEVKKLDNEDIQLLLEGEDPFFNIRKYFE